MLVVDLVVSSSAPEACGWCLRSRNEIKYKCLEQCLSFDAGCRLEGIVYCGGGMITRSSNHMRASYYVVYRYVKGKW